MKLSRLLPVCFLPECEAPPPDNEKWRAVLEIQSWERLCSQILNNLIGVTIRAMAAVLPGADKIMEQKQKAELPGNRMMKIMLRVFLYHRSKDGLCFQTVSQGKENIICSVIGFLSSKKEESRLLSE